MKTQFLFSAVFEKEDAASSLPFIFEKTFLTKRKVKYPDFKFEGPLFKKSKCCETDLKEKYFILSGTMLIQFRVRVIVSIFPPLL